MSKTQSATVDPKVYGAADVLPDMDDVQAMTARPIPPAPPAPEVRPPTPPLAVDPDNLRTVDSHPVIAELRARRDGVAAKLKSAGAARAALEYQIGNGPVSRIRAVWIAAGREATELDERLDQLNKAREVEAALRDAVALIGAEMDAARNRCRNELNRAVTEQVVRPALEKFAREWLEFAAGPAAEFRRMVESVQRVGLDPGGTALHADTLPVEPRSQDMANFARDLIRRGLLTREQVTAALPGAAV